MVPNHFTTDFKLQEIFWEMQQHWLQFWLPPVKPQKPQYVNLDLCQQGPISMQWIRPGKEVKIWHALTLSILLHLGPIHQFLPHLYLFQSCLPHTGLTVTGLVGVPTANNTHGRLVLMLSQNVLYRFSDNMHYKIGLTDHMHHMKFYGRMMKKMAQRGHLSCIIGFSS